MTIHATPHAPAIRNISHLVVMGALLAAAFGTGAFVERWQASDSGATVREPAVVAPSGVAVPPFSPSDLVVPSLSAQAELGRLAGTSPVTPLAPTNVSAPTVPLIPAIIPSEARIRELAQEAGSNPIGDANGSAVEHPIVPSAQSQARLAAEAVAR